MKCGYIDSSNNRWTKDYKFVKSDGIENVYKGEEVSKMLNPKTGFPKKKPETIIDIKKKDIDNIVTILEGEGLEIFNKVAHPESIIPTVDLNKKN